MEVEERVEIGARVITSDGQRVGTVDRVVVDRRSSELWAIVIHKGIILVRDIVVPVQTIDMGNGREVRLNVSADELAHFPDFVEEEFVIPPQAAAIGPYVPGTLLWPAAYVFAPDVEMEKRHVPPGSVAISEGTDVLCVDGKLGVVKEIIYDAEKERVLAFVVSRESPALEDVTVPAAWVSRADEERVELICRKNEVERSIS